MIRGGCLCGATQYEINSEPLSLYACHCTDCQTASGASFTLILIAVPDSIRVLKGEPRAFERARADGRKKNIFRCGSCLTALWGVRPDAAKTASIYAGTLDDSSAADPVGHIWTSSAQPWITIPSGPLDFEKDPDDMVPFIRAYQSRTT